MRQTFAVQQNRLAVAGVLALALSGLLALQRTSASTSQTVVAVGGDWAGQCSNVVTWTGITAIAAGDGHTVGLKSDGSVVAVGWNDSHQTEVSGWTGVTAIAAGYQHTVGLKGDGTVVAVGLNDNGQCDLSGWSGITAVAAGFGHTVGLKADGTVVAAGDNTHHECDVSGWTGITAIAAGWGHTLGVKDDGTVVATGLNDSGQCNVSSWSGIKAVGGGWLHSAGLKSDGTVVAVGTNDVGQCNVSGWSGIAAISTGCGHTVGLKNDGTVVATGWNENGQCNVAGMAGIAAIAAGKYHTVGLAVDPCVVINTNDSGPGSLRSAITYANANPGTTIRFSIPGPTTIRPASALPTLTANGTVIDGTTQPGYAGTPVIEVSGANAGAGVSGFQIAAANCVLKGLVANRFAVSGVRIGGASASGNLVQGCFIGTNATGGIAAPNGEDGVAILNGASNNAVGGTAVGMGNVLSGNAREGVAIWDAATSGNTVQGNKIGTNPTGDSAVPNQNLGVAIWWGAHDNTIGGTAPNAGNVISGNRNGGIYFAGASSTGNRVQGNRVGTNATGTAAVANGSVGIQLDGAVNATIGGTTAGARNLISGNNGQGIALSSAASSNVIQGNFIGTNGDGTAAIPNATHGVSAWGGAQSNTVGGTAAGAGNLVSGNAGIGIFFIDNCSGNTLQGNQVGTNAAGAAAIPNGWNGVEISGSPNNTIGGVASGAGNVISGNSASGISIIGGANGTRVQGNLIGTTKDGMAALGNAHTGIGLWDGPTDCVIGGTAAGAGNVVCASGHTGITLNGAHTLRTVVQGNLVGTNKAGSAAIGNSPQGITVESGASNNTIGGTAAGAGNIVSGSSYSGILLTGSGTSANVIQGNLIGTNKGGTAAFGNAYYGVEISDGAKNNAIGDGATGARNIISGNGRSGVYLHDTGTDGNTIQGNYIGTDKNGTSAVGNAEAAVLLAGGAKGNLIGGAGAGQGNLLSGNGHEGVAIWNAGTENNRVQGNLIGTDATGAVALGNRFQGILVGDGAKAVVGGTGSGEGNHIAFNSEAGIWVLDTSVGCVLRGNLVHSNGKVGIDLAGGTETLAGVTANDAGDADTGSNNLQNYPVLTGQTVTAGVTTLRGTLNSTANATFALDFFANTAADPSGYGEGESYLGSTSVTTNGSGNVTFTFGAGSGLGGKAFTATATNTATGDTSEFSQAFVDTTPTLAAQSGRTSAEGDIVDAQLAGAADADGDALTWSATGLPAGLSISAAGRVTGTVAYTASAGSPYTVTVTVTDGTPGGTGGDSASRTFAWTVTNSDATPTLAEIANQSSAEGDAINLAVLGADADGDTLAYGATGLPPGLQINGATGAITGTLPNLASSGSPYSVTVTVTDNTPGGIGGDSASRTFSWTVINVDAPPSLAAQPDRENFEGDAVNVRLTGAADPEGDTITWSATGLPPGLSMSTAGQITGTLPSTAAAGSPYTVAVTVTDNTPGGIGGDASTGTFTWTVLSPTLRVTSPNGGEEWVIGTRHDITWESAGCGGSVKVEITRDGGTTWQSLAATTSNTGTFPWTVTAPPAAPNTSRARVRVTSILKRSVFDRSDAEFSIRKTYGTSAATFRLKDGIAAAGGLVALPLRYTANGADIGQASFDVLFDAGKLSFVEARVAAVQGASVSTRLTGDRLSVTIMGFPSGVWDRSDIAVFLFRAAADVKAGGSTTVPVVLPRTALAGVEVADLAVSGAEERAQAFAATVHFGTYGDLNRNGIIDVGDVQLMVNVMLDESLFDIAKHDMDFSGYWGTGDLAAMVDLYLGQSALVGAGQTSPASQVRTGGTGASPAGQLGALANGPVVPLTFSTGTNRLTALAFDLARGIEAGTIQLATPVGQPIRTDVVAQISAAVGGRTRVLLYSDRGDPLPSSAQILVGLKSDPLVPVLPERPSRPGTIGNDGAPRSGALTSAAYVPPTPANLRATALSPSQIRLDWGPVLGVTGLRLERRCGTAAPTLIPVAAGAVTFTDGGLVQATTYSYRLCSLAGGAASAYTAFVSARTKAALPGAPTLLRAVATSSTAVHLTWNDNSTNETGFTVERKASVESTFTTLVPNKGANATASASYDDTHAEAGKTYSYRVRAFHADGVSAWCSPATVVVLAAPTRVIAKALSSTQMEVAWEYSGSGQSGFKYEASVDGAAYGQPVVTSRSPARVTVSAGHSYRYRVRAYNAGGVSSYSTSAAVTVLPAPTAAKASALSSTQVRVSWSYAGSGQTGFRIEWSVDGGIYASSRTGNSGTVVSVAPRHAYRFRVCATNTGGISSYAYTSAVTVLAAPTGLRVVSVAGRTVQLSWAFAGSGQSGFKVERSADNWAHLVTLPAVTSPSLSDRTVPGAGTYLYRVYAYNTGGPSSASPAVTARVP